MKRTITFVDAAQKKAVIEYCIELPKISRWKYPYKGAEKKRLVEYNQQQKQILYWKKCTPDICLGTQF